MKSILKTYWIEIVFVIGMTGLAFFRLDTIPAPWFDEGWTLSLARNWVVSGHYGHLVMGRPVQATILNAGLPVVAPVALSFRLLDIGVWQARLPGVILTLLALLLLYDLTRHLYQRVTALTTWFVIMALSVHPDMNPIMMGRQVMGEMYVVFYTLLGFYALWKSWKIHSWVYLLVSMMGWGAALQSKPQVAPFLTLSLALPGFIAGLQGHKKTTLYLWGGLAGALAVSWGIRYMERRFIGGGNDPYHMLGQVEVLFTYVLALNVRSRIYALVSLALFLGLFPLIGLLYVALRWLFHHNVLPSLDDFRMVLKVCLWVLGASWYYWYMGFSIGWSRYVFPAAIMASPFAAKWIEDVTGGLNFRATFREGALLLTSERNWKSLQVTLLLIMILIAFSLTFYNLSQVYASSSGGLREVVWFLNNDSDPTAIVETYESELYFLLNKPYHYPPDEIQHRLNQRKFFGIQSPIHYNPVAEIKPDYLVIGFMSRFWGLDEILLQYPVWHLALNTGLYQVYVRIK